MKGYTGKILLVDLTSRTWVDRPYPDRVYEQYLSGVGLAAYCDLPSHAPWRRPARPGQPAGLRDRHPDRHRGAVRRPLDGDGEIAADRRLGRRQLRRGLRPGYQEVRLRWHLFQGISEEPVYLYADGDRVEIRSAAHLWGVDANETEERLKAEAGGKRQPRVASIGMAGEKLSLISGICNDRGRLAGRSGLGAVMGSKRLKALVLAGSKPIRTAGRRRAEAPEQGRQCLHPQRRVPFSRLGFPDPLPLRHHPQDSHAHGWHAGNRCLP